MTAEDDEEFLNLLRHVIGLRPLPSTPPRAAAGTVLRRLLGALKAGPLPLRDVARAAGMRTDQACRDLTKLARRGQVRKVAPGVWARNRSAP